MNQHQVTKDFEKALCDYTGAKYAVAVSSCTAALFLCCKYHKVGLVSLPARTYVSVPMAVIHAGGKVTFVPGWHWRGEYNLYPYPIWDSARRFTGGMYSDYYWKDDQFVCVSFHASKILGLEQGGAILHDNEDADKWFRRARFDGRSEGVPPKEDKFDMLGWHCYMNPSTAAQGLLKLHSLPKHNDDLPNDDYPDLSQFEIFKSAA